MFSGESFLKIPSFNTSGFVVADAPDIVELHDTYDSLVLEIIGAQAEQDIDVRKMAADTLNKVFLMNNAAAIGAELLIDGAEAIFTTDPEAISAAAEDDDIDSTKPIEEGRSFLYMPLSEADLVQGFFQTYETGPAIRPDVDTNDFVLFSFGLQVENLLLKKTDLCRHEYERPKLCMGNWHVILNKDSKIYTAPA